MTWKSYSSNMGWEAEPRRETMNLIAAMLVSIWAAGWVAALVRAGMKARAAEPIDTRAIK